MFHLLESIPKVPDMSKTRRCSPDMSILLLCLKTNNCCFFSPPHHLLCYRHCMAGCVPERTCKPLKAKRTSSLVSVVAVLCLKHLFVSRQKAKQTSSWREFLHIYHLVLPVVPSGFPSSSINRKYFLVL